MGRKGKKNECPSKPWRRFPAGGRPCLSFCFFFFLQMLGSPGSRPGSVRCIAFPGFFYRLGYFFKSFLVMLRLLMLSIYRFLELGIRAFLVVLDQLPARFFRME